VTVFADTGFFVTIDDGSIFGDLIRQARGQNVAPDPGLGPVDPKQLAAADPDVYLATSDSGVTLDSLRRDPDTRNLTAVKDGRVVILPVDLVTRAGPNVGHALERVAAALHPDAFR
jgi:ABC-type Fe3+-hydroxamate transport system substrate-binding protein